MRLITAALAATIIISPGLFAQGQSSSSRSQSSASASPPRLIPLSGVFRPADGQPLAGNAETVTFAIYTEEFGGNPLWEETQAVHPDAAGRYSVLLGATLANGVPQEIFGTGEARWLGMSWARGGEPQTKRSRLTFVPYAVHATDADTLGGKPASAFALASSSGTDGTSASMSDPVAANTVFFGANDFLPKYANGTDLVQSTIYESSGVVGMGTSFPLDRLHVQFTNTSGALTGYAVQNLGNTATSYSGMLFYDQNGSLGQFQGFNNVTHEYRINNIASGGSINFMIASGSKFKVNNNGRIDLNTLASINGGTTTSRGGAAGWKPFDADANVGGGAVIIEGGNPASNTADSAGFYGDGDTAAIWSPGENGAILRVFDEDDLAAPNIGAAAFVIDGSGNINVGKGTTGCVRDGDGTILIGTCSSDIRLKKDIRPFEGGMLERLLKLRPIYYHWRTELMHKYIPENAGEAYGLIAQEVEKVYPEMVTTDEFGYKAVDYGKLQYVTLGALQEEHSNVVALQSQVVSLEQRLARLEAASAHSWKPATWMLFGGLIAAALGFAYVRRPQITPRAQEVPTTA
jgi:endosialidase-like protein